MSNQNEKFLSMTGNLFTFTSYGCECMMDIEHISKKEVRQTLKIRGLSDKPLTFAYAPEKGLVRLADTGAINSERILTELISLPDGNIEKLQNFFEEYGFLFCVNSENYEAINMSEVLGIINRIKATVQLMSELENMKMNYIKILGLTMYLQLETPVQISLNNYQEPYFTCDHQLYNAIQNIDQISLIDGSTEAYMTNTYQIEDTVRGPYYALNAEQYEDLVNGYAEETNGVVDSQLYKHFALLFRNATDAGYECRQLIDFFYHFLSEIGIIKNWYCNGHLDFYENEVTWKDNYRKNFDKNMKCALLKIAKLTIKEELEYNLRGVLPTYDTKAMAPGWHIIDLLTGLYFSIFYMHPGIEIYRKCANPNCNRYFLVKTTNTRKKYCNAACSNAMAQRNHRKKVKVKKAVQ